MRTPNTIDAHRLIHWAGIEGRQTPLVDHLFHAYFIEGQDISDQSVLVELAAAVGMDAEVTASLLEGRADIEEIKTRDANARQRGISGVPCFIIDNQYAVQGAQPTETWRAIIEELLEKEANLSAKPKD